MAAKGLLSFMTDQVVLMHKVGQGVKKVAGRNFGIQSPVREYYQTRDGLKLLFGRNAPFKARLGFICTVFLRPWIHVLLWNNRFELLKYVCAGVFDFVCGRSGCYTPYRKGL